MDASKHVASRQRVYREGAEVVKVTPLAGGHCRLQLRTPEIAAAVRPGQFVNISPPLDSAILRRPLGVYRTIDGTDIEVLFKSVGRGTLALLAVQPGDRLDIIGPLGNGFNLDKIPATAILVAGGFGLAPLHPLAEALRGRAKQACLFVGTEEELPLETSDSSMHASFVDPNVNVTVKDFEDLGAVCRVATARQRPGYFPGVVTELLEKFLHHSEPEAPAKIYACGPWAMLKKTAAVAEEHGIPCDVLLEERMGCGIGACMSCAVRVKGQGGQPVYARACVEGPVFDAAEVDWDAK